MKRTFIIIIVLMSLDTPTYASNISQQWVKIYRWSNNGYLTKILQTSDGGYFAAGSDYDTHQIAAMKLDSNGDVSWLKSYPAYPVASSLSDIYTVEEAIDGGYLIAGTTWFLDIIGGWILKLDTSGDIIWQKVYDGIAQFDSIQRTTDGGYIAAASVVSDSLIYIAVLKLNNDGDIIWQKPYLYGQDTMIRQTLDSGYIVVGNDGSNVVLKLDSAGNIVWQYAYDGPGYACAIEQTSDGGYIITGGMDAATVLRLDSNGGLVWHKEFIFDGYYYDPIALSIHQSAIGEYTVLVNKRSPVDSEIFVLKLNDNGNIIGQKTYGGNDHDFAYYHGNTIDEGYVILGVSASFAPGNFMVMKLNSNGEIQNCDITNSSDVIVSERSLTVRDTGGKGMSPPFTIIETSVIPEDIAVETSVVCYYEDLNDIDGDGVETNPGAGMASSMYSSSFLAEGDNCSDMPNGPYLGTCTEGKIGSTCIAHAACGVNGFCSMNQEDSYPPQGNGIGDACDCEGNFNCDTDRDVDGSDAALFKADFGRSAILNPCNTESPCNGDFNCDGDADGTDAALFKADFGRNSIQNPCPACVTGVEWCSYTLP